MRETSATDSKGIMLTVACGADAEDDAPWDWVPNDPANDAFRKILQGTSDTCRVWDKPGTTPKAGCRRVVVTRSGHNVYGGTVWSVMAQLSCCWGKNAEGKQVILGQPSGGMGVVYMGQAWFCGWRVIPPGNPAQPATTSAT